MFRQKGFTLLEIIIVLSLIGILSAAWLNGFADSFQKRQLHLTAVRLQSDLHWLRARARVVDTDGVAVFKENGYRLECYGDNTLVHLLKQRPYPAAITGTDARLGFTSRGSAKYAGSVVLNNRHGQQVRLTVAPVTGKITMKG